MDAIALGIEREPQLMQPKWAMRHERGPLRDLLALEHPGVGRPASALAVPTTEETRRENRQMSDQVQEDPANRPWMVSPPSSTHWNLQLSRTILMDYSVRFMRQWLQGQDS